MKKQEGKKQKEWHHLVFVICNSFIWLIAPFSVCLFFLDCSTTSNPTRSYRCVSMRINQWNDYENTDMMNPCINMSLKKRNKEEKLWHSFVLLDREKGLSSPAVKGVVPCHFTQPMRPLPFHFGNPHSKSLAEDHCEVGSTPCFEDCVHSVHLKLFTVSIVGSKKVGTWKGAHSMDKRTKEKLW